jgi:hypothetical protein
VRRSNRERGEGRLGCFLWVLLAGLIAYGAFKIIPVKFAASRFADFMNEESAFGYQKQNPTILRELLAQAQELELPITKEQIEITRTRELITIAVHYEVPIKFFGQLGFVWKFDPVVTRALVYS